MIKHLHAVASGDAIAKSPSRNQPLSEVRFSSLLTQGFARIIAKIGKGTFSDKIERTPRSIDNILAGGIPSAKVALDALLADETALDEVLAEYGFRLTRINAGAICPLDTTADMCRAAGMLAHAMADGRLDHNEILAIGGALRPLMPQLQALISKSDQIRTGAA